MSPEDYYYGDFRARGSENWAHGAESLPSDSNRARLGRARPIAVTMCLTLGFLIHDFWDGRQSSIFGVWAAPGARETIQKYEGLRPPYF